MAKKQKCPECPKCLPGWLVQFGDLMSLLLTFFILLLSMAIMDTKKVEEYFEVMKKAMGFLDQTQDTVKREESTNTSMNSMAESEMNDSTNDDAQNSEDEINDIVQQMNSQSLNESEEIKLEKGKNEFTLDIPSVIMFKQGEYVLGNAQSKEFISKIARILRSMPQSYNIEIIGHTDTNRQQSNNIPRDSWDLSALRSISVVKELIKNRIDPANLKVSAHASYQPRSDSPGDNRRVEMRFYSQANQNDILEQESFFDRLE